MTMYPGAIYRPTSITHATRRATWGVVLHWTAGHEPGDVSVLRGPNVDVQFYVAQSGRVYQFMDVGSEAWHAFHTANHNTVGIETEGSGEAWTDQQFRAIVRLSAWLARLFAIPAVHVDPTRSHPDGMTPPPADWHGFMGHRDLAGIDGNNHTDTVPAGTGWGTFLSAVQAELHPAVKFVPPWPVFNGAKQIANGTLINPVVILRISRALRAAGNTPPYTAYVDGKAVATGKFWPPGEFTRKLSGHLHAGRDVHIDPVTIRTHKA